MLLINITAYGQSKSTGVLNDTYFFNEYWSWSKGPYFKNYYFADNGRFIHGNGYSGGIYTANSSEGRYTYDPVRKEIRLHIDKEVSGKITSLIEPTSDKIELKNLNDTTVTVSLENDSSKVITMDRKVGVTTDQHWYKGSNSSHDAIHFTLFGQAKIVQESDTRREYICNYHISGDLLLLEIISITAVEGSNEKQTKLFTPTVKTFLKVRFEKEHVAIEKVDLDKIMDGARTWNFHNMEFHIENNAPRGNITEWDQYNRVR